MSLYKEMNSEARNAINEISDNMHYKKSARNISKGKRVHILNKNMPLTMKELEEGILCDCRVFSESSFGSYKVEFEVNKFDKHITYTSCTCADFRNNKEYERNYMCKHIIGGVFRLFDYIERENPFKAQVSLEERFLEIFNTEVTRSEELGLEIILDIDERSFATSFDVSLKIGFNKKYLVKNILEFLKARSTGDEVVLGKMLTYNSNIHYFSAEDEKLLNFLELTSIGFDRFKESLGIRATRNIGNKGKTLKLDKSTLRQFLECLGEKTLSVNIGEETYTDINVQKGRLPIEISLNEMDENIRIKLSKFEFLTENCDVCLYNNSLYILEYEQLIYMSKLNKLLKEDYIDIGNNLEVLFEKVMPGLRNLGSIKVDKKIEEKVLVGDFTVEFFVDRYRGNIFIDRKVSYGDTLVSDVKDRYVVRDKQKEFEVYQDITELGFRKQGEKYIFDGSDDELYHFLDKGVHDIQKLGSVFYSESFKKFNIVRSPQVSAGVSEEKDYLAFTFEVEDLGVGEVKQILDAIESGKKYFRLSDESFLDLAGKEMLGFLNLVKSVDDVKISKDDNIYRINKNRAMYIADYLDKKNIGFVKGRELVDGISKKISEIKNMEFEIPNKLNAVLREYQVEGYKWFKTLAHFGFAGILADEMGLGKTLQTITYILSEEGSKSLIVTPTALIYNWKNEFSKFAPSLNIGIAHGTKKQREEILTNIDKYDVILTTYGTLKNDDFYSEYNFDIMIIDEAQNIKNVASKSAIAVKDVNSKIKFALTGTPIENNLLELWSIFDYAMPGYLFNRNKFTRKFITDANSFDELNNAIKPFILRRQKKDVLKELPDKIEKQFFVELSKEQKKVYGTYVKSLKKEMKNSEDKSKIEVLAYLTKLRQLCLDPTIVVDDYKGENSKLEIALEMIGEYIANGHKILLFSQFTSVLATIKDKLDEKKLGYYYIDGSVNAKDRLDLVDEFNSGNDKKIFLISLKAGGTGLNLTSADVVIHFDPWWNPAVEDQATDRAHRMGQENKVEVIKLISKGTIEEKIIELQDDKKGIIEKVMNGNLANGSILSSLSENEIVKLFDTDF